MEAKNNNQQAIGLQTFLNENIGAEIRTITVDEELFFVGRDIGIARCMMKAISASDVFSAQCLTISRS